MPTQQEEMENILEKFAEQEHIRWAEWQNYLHSRLTWNNDLQVWVLPHEWKDRWQRQIQTPYSMLSEKEKDSDREQVKPYLDFLQSEIARAVAQREKEIFRKIKDYDFKENHLCGFNDGEQDCKCFIAGLNVALSLITKPNDKPNN